MTVVGCKEYLVVSAVGWIVLGHVGTAIGDQSQVFDATVLFNEYESAKGAASDSTRTNKEQR